MNLLKSFPGESEIVQNLSVENIYKFNCHIHTPYSFSAFSKVSQAFEMAANEGIRILGINDFCVTDGYDEFYKCSLKTKIFPLFNIEFISLSSDFQKRGIRVNDPNNPGRIYFSGKGLDYPPTLPAADLEVIDNSIKESQQQVESMIIKTNAWLKEIEAGFQLDFSDIKKKYAKNLVRERHIAKALRFNIYETYRTQEEKKAFFKKFFYGNDVNSKIDNFASIENEIRNRILKAGGKAFVEENERAFLNLDSVVDIILNAGGIPCYPVLLDDPKGNITEFEINKDDLFTELNRKNIFCIELIPTRNNYTILKEFVEFFNAKGFIILFGTEHNTPELSPLTVTCRDNVELDQDLNKIASDGACVIAAHQYLRAQGSYSKIFQWNLLSVSERKRLTVLGRSVVERFINA